MTPNAGQPSFMSLLGTAFPTEMKFPLHGNRIDSHLLISVRSRNDSCRLDEVVDEIADQLANVQMRAVKPARSSLAYRTRTPTGVSK